MSNSLTLFSQENCLSLLCFDDENFKLVRNAVTPEMFDSPYKEVAEKAIDYIDRYKLPPKDQISDELEKLISGEQGGKYQEILKSIYYLKTNLNAKYVVDKLIEFIRDRTFEKALYDAAELHSRGRIEEAQEVMDKAKKVDLTLFDPGIRLTDINILAKSLDEEDIFPTGVTVLDQLKVGPARKQVFLFMAAASKGKSWWHVQLGKLAVKARLKVVHITLEMSQEIALQRYIQSFLGISRWQYQAINSPMFVRDGNQMVIRIDQAEIQPRSMDDPDILDYVGKQLKRFGPAIENCMRIKEFPTGTLTMQGLEGYLDGLERTENYMPDLVIIDHASHMHIPIKDFRLAMGRLFVNLRGLSVERNFALATAHQLNREGAKAKSAGGEHVSEDWSIIGTVDTAGVYSQSKMEAKYKLARFLIARARSMRSLFTLLLAQNYDVGQFALDSSNMPKGYNAKGAISNKKDTSTDDIIDQMQEEADDT